MALTDRTKGIIKRAFWRFVRAGLAAGVSAVVGYLVNVPELPFFLAPILLAVDKAVRDALE